MKWPSRGVYFFQETSGNRSDMGEGLAFCGRNVCAKNRWKHDANGTPCERINLKIRHTLSAALDAESDTGKEYLHDALWARQFAAASRKAMAEKTGEC